GHYDPRQNFDGSLEIQIPPLLADVDPWLGETAADNRFVTFDGPDDQLPEMAIGRLPVNSVAELQTVLQKIEAYDSAELGAWAGRITVVSDDTDEAGDFADHSDKLIRDFFPRPWQTNRYYLPQAQDDGGVLLDSIRNSWNAGNGLVMFTGHSSIHQWAAERLFHIDEVPSLEHAGQLPIVMGMSCFTSSFHYPEADVMDEDLLRRLDGGAVATWGATGLGVSTGHDSLANGFLNTIFNTDDKSLGSAAVAGKLKLVIDQSTHVDLLDTFTLFGDPATQARLTQPADGTTMYLPIISEFSRQ
ncbi:MAG: C25 family cysteine peptidase, partial [Anaerolineae bacterium]